jgi:hypothetical protein
MAALEKKESSRHGTPEEKSAGSLNVEDGAAARQDRKNQEDGAAAWQDGVGLEDGAESQQEESEDSQSVDEKQGQGRTKDTMDKQSLKMMLLKLMQGMQDIQRQIVVSKDETRGDDVEIVRYVSDLPKLVEWSPETAPIDFGGEMWWDLTLSTTRAWYDNHTNVSPIQRLTNVAKPTPELQQKKWARLERRASSLALPELLKEEVIASKSITALGILTRAMLQFQPGGLTERSAILSAAAEVDQAEKERIRSWSFHSR